MFQLKYNTLSNHNIYNTYIPFISCNTYIITNHFHSLDTHNTYKHVIPMYNISSTNMRIIDISYIYMLHTACGFVIRFVDNLIRNCLHYIYINIYLRKLFGTFILDKFIDQEFDNISGNNQMHQPMTHVCILAFRFQICKRNNRIRRHQTSITFKRMRLTRIIQKVIQRLKTNEGIDYKFSIEYKILTDTICIK